MRPDFSEEQLSSKIAYAGRLLTLKEDQVRLPSGVTATREYVQHPGAVMIIPLLEDGTILLEHQYRYPLRQHFLELPAGRIEPNEPPEHSARRELLEETGYVAREWSFLTTLHPCIGYSDERIELFLARGLSFEGHPGEDDEFIETLNLSLDAALDRVFARQITDAKTIIGLFWADRLRREGRA
jgi:ADP-ribose pyrophosphatase